MIDLKTVPVLTYRELPTVFQLIPSILLFTYAETYTTDIRFV